ncbi:MAG: N-acetylmuramoyl-L-alanine amidase [Bacteroidota bacterium]
MLRSILLALIALSAVPALAVDIQRVSITERSDGLGYVVRLHAVGVLSQFEVRQDAPSLVELVVQDARLHEDAQLDAAEGLVRNYSVRNRDGSVVLLFELTAPAEAVPYPDRDTDDLLLGLTYADPAAAPAASDTPTSPFFAADDGTENWRLDCVVIDAGHGGHDPGTHGHGIREKDVTLDVALRVGRYVEERLGMNVVYTRTTDRFVELHERGRIANEQCGKLFVSIHANAAGSSRARGTETFFIGQHKADDAREIMERENSVVELEADRSHYEGFGDMSIVLQSMASSMYQTESEQLAAMIESQFSQRARRHSRGVKQAGFLVLWRASMPAVLVELGFLSNRSEARFLASEEGQDLLASGIFRAIRDYKQHYESSLGLVPDEVAARE